jgi:signal transduction histidine kinase
VQAALYRMAQESLTNAVRHARRATRIDVRVLGDVDFVHLTVTDDGEPAPVGRSSSGYGLVGMKERATLLGGTFTAGPGTLRGWIVDAELPRGTEAR